MKIKFSKKILSVILAVLMVVTSIPVIGFAAFAAGRNSLSDPAVIEVQSAMDELYTKLSTAGQSFTNVVPAYEAYVECQKAIDSYVYGGEDNALDGKADALKDAIAAIGIFTGVSANAIPSFETDYEGSKYDTYQTDKYGVSNRNILYTTTTTQSNKAEAKAYNLSAGNDGNVYHRVYYPAETTVLYDGSANTPLIPVMGMASVDASKTRYTYTLYPCVSTNDNGNNANFRLNGYWHDNGSENLDFAWNWQQSANGPGYDREHWGDETHRSAKLDYTTSWGAFRTGKTKYYANTMEYYGVPESTYSEYTLTWFATSGDGANSDGAYLNATNNKIIVVNYKTLIDSMAANGAKMKTVKLSNYSEGGLAQYISAMEAATKFDPNSYFVSSNDYIGCSNEIARLANEMTNASVGDDVKNSSEYQALRAAMSEAVRNTYFGNNTGYTEESWGTFASAYAAAQTIMAATNDTGYGNTSGAASAAAALTAAYEGLETSATKVDVTELTNVINAFENYNSAFFTNDTYSQVVTTVVGVKEEVWGSVDNYGVATALPDDSEEARVLVEQQLEILNDAIKTLDISTAAVVPVSNGDRYSLDEAIALADGINSSDYSNYAAMQTAINNANVYKTAIIPTRDFTDYQAHVDEYVQYVDAIVTAYQGLEYSFTRIPDGTVTGVQNTSITTLSNTISDNYHYWMDFSYPGNAVVFRTSHDPMTVTYGQANTTFKINIDHNTSKTNNGLDSITINGTADAAYPICESGAFTDQPQGMNDSQKATYAAGLSANGFSLTNFRITDMVNQGHNELGVKADGTRVYDRNPADDSFTQILGTTDGTQTNPPQGIVRLMPSKAGDSSVTLTADMNFDIPSTTAPSELSASTKPTLSTYSHRGYFGAVYAWNTQPVASFAGYSYMTSKSNNQYVISSVSVVDITNLVDLVEKCNELSTQSSSYTEASWNNLLTNLQAAQAPLNYSTMTANNIYTNVVTRYNNLWSAYSSLEHRNMNVTFDYYNAQGEAVSSVFEVKFGATLNDIADEISAIQVPSYSDTTQTYTFKEWSPAISYDNPIMVDTTYTAVYDSKLNLASWDNYNAQINALRNALKGTDDKKLPVEVLSELQTIFDVDSTNLKYYKIYLNSQQDTVFVDQQYALDEEAAYIASLIPNEEQYIQVQEALTKVMEKDIDQYDSTELEKLQAGLEQNVEVGVSTYEGVAYTDQDALDQALRDALNSAMTYTVYLNGEPIYENVPYGELVTLDENGLVLDESSASENVCAWYGYFAAPSYGDYAGGDGEYRFNTSEERLLTNSNTYSFVVKGDSYLTAKTTDDPQYGYKVTYMFDGRIVYIDYTDADGNFTVIEPETYAFYEFSNYSDGYQAGQEANINKDIVITANYNIADSGKASYTIEYFGFGENDDSGTIYADYNELVSITSNKEDFYCWTFIDADGNYVVYSYSNELNFYACEDLLLVPWSAAEINEFKTYGDTFIYSNGEELDTSNAKADVYALPSLVPKYDSEGTFTEFSMIGRFTVPENYTVLEKGFLINLNDTDPVAFDITDESLERVKVLHLTTGKNQYVLDVSGIAQDRNIDYCAYLIVEHNETGQRETIYSNPVMNVNASEA